MVNDEGLEESVVCSLDSASDDDEERILAKEKSRATYVALDDMRRSEMKVGFP